MWLSLSLIKITSIKKVQGYFTFPVEKETMSEETTREFTLVFLYNKPLNFAIAPVPAAFEWLKTIFQNYIWFAWRASEEETSVCQINQSSKLDIWKLTESITQLDLFTSYTLALLLETTPRKCCACRKQPQGVQARWNQGSSSTSDGFCWKGCTTPLGVPAPSPSLHTFLSEFSSLLVAIMFEFKTWGSENSHRLLVYSSGQWSQAYLLRWQHGSSRDPVPLCISTQK